MLRFYFLYFFDRSSLFPFINDHCHIDLSSEAMSIFFPFHQKLLLLHDLKDSLDSLITVDVPHASLTSSPCGYILSYLILSYLHSLRNADSLLLLTLYFLFSINTPVVSRCNLRVSNLSSLTWLYISCYFIFKGSFLLRYYHSLLYIDLTCYSTSSSYRCAN